MTRSKLSPLREATVLLAEDDRATRESLARTLEIHFGEVLAAPDGSRALALFERRPVHLAVLDVRMPGPSGLDVAARIREEDPDLPVIVLTCHDDTAYMQTAVRLRLMDYLLKPVDLPALEDALLRCLEWMRRRHRLETRLAGGAVLNPLAGTVARDGATFRLTRNEKRFLSYMLQRRGTLVDPRRLCAVLDPGEDFSPAALRNLVYRLRQKLGPDAVVCGKDAGYAVP